MALASICFGIAGLAGVWGMNHFQLLLLSNRRARKVEIERGIQAMKDKLAESDTASRSV
jgi:hypothetical protein